MGSYVMPDGRPVGDADIKVFSSKIDLYKKEYESVSRARGQIVSAVRDALKASGISIVRSKLSDPSPFYAPTPYIEEAKRWVDNKALRDAEDERKKAASELTTKAMLWLIERGKILGTDFTHENALSIANEIARDEEVERMIAAGGYHDFSGQNCDGPCRGWDGVSRRCECGNRRVDWVQTDWHSFESPSVAGEAY